jgi:uncharacterized protein YjiS (DUF1127 family)
MTECSFDTPRRGLKSYANLPARPVILRQILHLWRRLFPGRTRDHVRHLSDHLARDIGLGRNDMARHRHVWPSESTNRPSV